MGGNKNKRIDYYHELERREDIKLVITSYEMYRTDITHFRLVHDVKPFDVMYIDEAHKVKSGTSQIGEAIYDLDIKQKYAITATPIINEIVDMHNILYWLGLIPYDLSPLKTLNLA